MNMRTVQMKNSSPQRRQEMFKRKHQSVKQCLFLQRINIHINVLTAPKHIKPLQVFKTMQANNIMCLIKGLVTTDWMDLVQIVAST